MKQVIFSALLFSFIALSFCIYKVSRITGGEQYIYSWRSEGIGYSDIKHLYNTDTIKAKSFFSSKTLQQFQVSLSCTIKETKLSKNGKGLVTCFQIVRPELKLKQGGIFINTEKLEKDLCRPVLVEKNEQGKIKTVRIDTASSILAAGILKEVLSRIQFTRPSKNGTAWQAIEENPSGSFIAHYRSLGITQDGFQYEKINAGFIRLKNSSQKMLINGKTNISVDTAGTITDIHVNEGQAVIIHNDTITASVSKINVFQTGKIRVSYRELFSLHALDHASGYREKEALSSSLSDEKITRLSYANTLGNDDFDKLIKALKSANETEAQQEEALVLKFRALAYLFPEECSKIGSFLQKEPPGSFSFRVLSTALANAETPAAVNAIAEAIRIRNGEETAIIDLLPNLATTTTPTAKAINVVKNLAFGEASSIEVKSTAQLALGGMAFNLKKIDPKKSEEVISVILKRMKSEADTVQKLLVLSNTGSATVLPQIVFFMNSASASLEVRNTALSALRLIETKESHAILKMMLSSKDTVLSRTAKEVLDFKKEYFQDNKM